MSSQGPGRVRAIAAWTLLVGSALCFYAEFVLFRTPRGDNAPQQWASLAGYVLLIGGMLVGASKGARAPDEGARRCHFWKSARQYFRLVAMSNGSAGTEYSYLIEAVAVAVLGLGIFLILNTMRT